MKPVAMYYDIIPVKIEVSEGHTLDIVPCVRNSMFEITTDTGSVPDYLKGCMFTSVEYAKREIYKYIEQMPIKQDLKEIKVLSKKKAK